MRSRSSKRSPKGQFPKQPDLWQASSCEEIIQLLSALNFDGTEKAFNSWISNNSIETEEELQKQEPAVHAARRAAMDWNAKLDGWNNSRKQLTTISKEKLEVLLQEFQNYDFGKWLSNFSASLLQLLYRLMQDLISTYTNKETPAESAKDQTPPEGLTPPPVPPAQKEGPFPPYLHEQSALYELIACMAKLLLGQKKNPKSHLQTIDLLKEARKAFPQDGQLCYLLAACYYQNKQNKDARQQYAKSLLFYPELTEKILEQSAPISLPKEIKQLLHNQQPARAVALGTLQGIFQLIELPKDFSLVDAANQKALDSYQALFNTEKAAMSPAKNTSRLTACRKQLIETDPDLYKKYMALVKSRESS